MYSKTYSFGLSGLDAYTVEVEADIIPALPSFDVVGLPDTAIKESRDRVKSALKNTGYNFPAGKVTANLAPADTKKAGPVYDLPILISILRASHQLDVDISDACFIGELSLYGELRRVAGVLPMVIEAKKQGFLRIFIPEENRFEASAISGIDIYPVDSVTTLIKHLRDEEPIAPITPLVFEDIDNHFNVDFSEVKGQYTAKRAIEIAAAGGHNLLMIGPPGAGKSMIAKRIPTILPDLTFDEAIEVTKIHSIAGALPADVRLIRNRPYRAPHHTITRPGLAGGGTNPRPGEISLAHNGVLFLDELPEFSKSNIETLRQPLENDTVTISRAIGSVTYPSKIMLIGAMNPCPCGFFGTAKRCTCTPAQAQSYITKISGPLLDRFDMLCEVTAVPFDRLSSISDGEPSEDIRKRVTAARQLQRDRYKNDIEQINSKLSTSMIDKYCSLTKECRDILAEAFDKLGLSARGYNRILKVARTIADLENNENITEDNLYEAISYRTAETKYWKR